MCDFTECFNFLFLHTQAGTFDTFLFVLYAYIRFFLSSRTAQLKKMPFS